MNSAPSQGRKRVVVIEDDEDFITLVEMILATEDVEIRPYLTGRAGLEAVRTLLPDAVLLDVMLPDLNGWEVFLQLRQEPATADIPVIILTSHSTCHDRTFGLQVAQVHDYITKPCLPSRLRASVRSALAKSAPAPAAG